VNWGSTVTDKVREPKDGFGEGPSTERKSLDLFDVPEPIPVGQPWISAMIAGLPPELDTIPAADTAPADFED
jgi:hypothetical protein